MNLEKYNKNTYCSCLKRKQFKFSNNIGFEKKNYGINPNISDTIRISNLIINNLGGRLIFVKQNQNINVISNKF
jgi:hypothetical protein